MTGRGETVVLVIEDSAECATTIEIALSAIPGIAVRVASSAEEALQVLELENISAVVTDLHLPSMDGLDLLARLRQDPRYRTTPVLVISGDADPATPGRLVNQGATAFFTKPYSPAAVRRTLETLIDAK